MHLRTGVALVVLAAAPLLAMGCSHHSKSGFAPPAAPQADDHGDDASAATALGAPQPPSPPPNPVAPWLQRAGGIQVAGDVDWFSVDLLAGLDYTFVTTVDASTDTVLRLIDRDGTTQLAENDDSIPGPPGTGIDLGSRITSQVPVAGVYYLEVRAKSAPGSYTIFAKQGQFTGL